MSTFTIDFDQLWMMPTATGMRLTEREFFHPYHFRLEIDASSRDDWKIGDIYMVDEEIISQTPTGCRTKEHLVKLEGSWAAECKQFFYHTAAFESRIQDKVDYECIPERETETVT